MKFKKLLPDSVPSNFPGLPQYFNKTIPDRRSESTSREARFQKQNDANEVEVEEFLAADKIFSLQELQEKWKMTSLKVVKFKSRFYLCINNAYIVIFPSNSEFLSMMLFFKKF